MKKLRRWFKKFISKKQLLTKEQQKAIEEVSYDKAKEILKEEEKKLEIIQKKLKKNLIGLFKDVALLE